MNITLGKSMFIQKTLKNWTLTQTAEAAGGVYKSKTVNSLSSIRC